MSSVDESQTSLGFKKQDYGPLTNIAMSDDTSAEDGKTTGDSLKDLKGTWTFIIMFACL